MHTRNRGVLSSMWDEVNGFRNRVWSCQFNFILALGTTSLVLGINGISVFLFLGGEWGLRIRFLN